MPLAFPSPAAKRWTEETEDAYGQSPVTADNSPAFAIDPGLLNEQQTQSVECHETQYQQHDFQQPPLVDHHDHLYIHYHQDPSLSRPYSHDLPQGPPPEPVFPPDSEEPTIEVARRKPHKKARREKRPRKELNCGFCLGNDQRNKEGKPEAMLSCSNCGRSGHPTCLEIAHIVDTVSNYAWTCIECKACEICKDKGDDTKLLFCDNCDRGWHYDCLNPALDGPPDGNWNCPYCPPVPEEPIASTSYVAQLPDAEFDQCLHESEGEDGGAEGGIPGEPCSQLASDRAGSHAQNKARRSKGKEKAKITPSRSVISIGSKRHQKSRLSHPVSSRHAAAASASDTISSHHQYSQAQPKVTFRLRLGRNKQHHTSDDEQKSPFENFLSPEEYDTTKSTVAADDKNRFEKSRITAETKLHPPTPVSASFDFGAGPSTNHNNPTPARPLRSSTHMTYPDQHSAPGGTGSTTISTPGIGTPTSTRPHAPYAPSSLALSALADFATSKRSGGKHSHSHSEQPPLRIRTIRFGQWDIDTWYDAPFAEEYNNIPEGRLWMCEFCLKYMKSGFGWERHQTKCKSRHPPGDEIYRDGVVSVFEVDGRRNKIYCQNLCLLSKMFLDHKSLFYDVEPFLFYVMTEVDEGGAHFVGYFSKEKRSLKDCNLSCIMTLPVRQRRGWGNLLIDFSYLLSKKEQRAGSPERPLSALGALSYRSYWTLAVMKYLHTVPDHVTFESILASTAMMIPDIVVTLRDQNMLTVHERPRSPVPQSPLSVKGSKGKKIRPRSSLYSRRSSNRKSQLIEEKEETSSEPSIPESYSIHWDRNVVTQYLAKWNSKGYLTLRPSQLKWSPYLTARVPKTDVAPHVPLTVDELPPTTGIVNLIAESVESSTILNNDSGPGSASADGGATAVEQVASMGYADAGPSKPSPTIVLSASPHSPTTTSPQLEVDDQEDSAFEPDDGREDSPSPSSPPKRISLRNLSRNMSEISDARSGVSEGRRTRGQDRESTQSLLQITNARSSSSQQSLRVGRVMRKRLRLGSPESSLTEQSYTRSVSPSIISDDGIPNGAPDLRLRKQLTNGNADDGRRTRSSASVDKKNSPNKSLSTRPSRRHSLRLNVNSGEDVFDSTRLPDHFIDDPEDALRKRKRARLEEAIARQHRPFRANAFDVISLSPRHTTIALAAIVNGNGMHNREQQSMDVDSPLGEQEVENVLHSVGDDADAEGEEEVLETINHEDGELDAEGELDLDAEGEMEEAY